MGSVQALLKIYRNFNYLAGSNTRSFITMNSFNVALIGCGTVGGGVVKILSEMNHTLNERAGRPVKIAKIVELNPESAMQRFGIAKEAFCGGGKKLTVDEANN